MEDFSRRVREWVKTLKVVGEVWDSWVSYQMMFFFANCGMRTGELCKVRRKDVQFFLQNNPKHPTRIFVVLLMFISQQDRFPSGQFDGWYFPETSV